MIDCQNVVDRATKNSRMTSCSTTPVLSPRYRGNDGRYLEQTLAINVCGLADVQIVVPIMRKLAAV
jgi:hypothetical protein